MLTSMRPARPRVDGRIPSDNPATRPEFATTVCVDSRFRDVHRYPHSHEFGTRPVPDGGGADTHDVLTSLTLESAEVPTAQQLDIDADWSGLLYDDGAVGIAFTDDWHRRLTLKEKDAATGETLTVVNVDLPLASNNIVQASYTGTGVLVTTALPHGLEAAAAAAMDAVEGVVLVGSSVVTAGSGDAVTSLTLGDVTVIDAWVFELPGKELSGAGTLGTLVVGPMAGPERLASVVTAALGGVSVFQPSLAQRYTLTYSPSTVTLSLCAPQLNASLSASLFGGACADQPNAVRACVEEKPGTCGMLRALGFCGGTVATLEPGTTPTDSAADGASGTTSSVVTSVVVEGGSGVAGSRRYVSGGERPCLSFRYAPRALVRVAEACFSSEVDVADALQRALAPYVVPPIDEAPAPHLRASVSATPADAPLTNVTLAPGAYTRANFAAALQAALRADVDVAFNVTLDSGTDAFRVEHGAGAAFTLDFRAPTTLRDLPAWLGLGGVHAGPFTYHAHAGVLLGAPRAAGRWACAAAGRLRYTVDAGGGDESPRSALRILAQAPDALAVTVETPAADAATLALAPIGSLLTWPTPGDAVTVDVAGATETVPAVVTSVDAYAAPPTMTVTGLFAGVGGGTSATVRLGLAERAPGAWPSPPLALYLLSSSDADARAQRLLLPEALGFTEGTHRAYMDDAGAGGGAAQSVVVGAGKPALRGGSARYVLVTVSAACADGEGRSLGTGNIIHPAVSTARGEYILAKVPLSVGGDTCCYGHTVARTVRFRDVSLGSEIRLRLVTPWGATYRTDGRQWSASLYATYRHR